MSPGADLIPPRPRRPEGGSTAPVHAGAVVAQEMLARAVGELPALAELGAREQLPAAAWLTSLRSARTRQRESAASSTAGHSRI